MQSKTLAMSGRSTLGKPPAQVPTNKLDKSSLDGFKASSNLNAALFKERRKSNNTRVLADSAKQLLKQVRIVKQLQKSMPKKPLDEQFSAQISSLNHYKPPPPNPKTHQLVSRITLSRRQNHLNTLSQFQTELEGYLESLSEITKVAKSQAVEFMKISDEEMEEYGKGLQDGELLKREKEVLKEIEAVFEGQNVKRLDKVQAVHTSFEERENQRTAEIQKYTEGLWRKLLECAFVLEDQAKKIANQLADKTKARQTKEKEENDQFIAEFEKNQREKFEKLKSMLQDKQQRWKQLKHNEAMQQFEKDLQTPEYKNPNARKALYNKLREQQQLTHTARKALIEQLVSSPHYTKTSVEKWIDSVKNKNDEGNAQLDKLLEDLTKEGEKAKAKSLQRLDELRGRLNYVGLNTEDENNKILKEKAEPIIEENEKNAKEQLKNVMAYVEKYDARENELCEKFGKFILKIGTKNDDNKKAMDAAAQAYELNKAKLLDQDEQKVDKLTQQLTTLKQSLRQSLHHPKLQSLQSQCFSKIDELEAQYRSTHDLNKKLVNEHPPQIQKLVEKVEAETAEVFQLFGPERKAELVEKNKKEAEEKAIKRIELEDKKKAEEEARQVEETKKKTGKAPPAPKPKDPKKAAAELEERKQAILKEIGLGEVKEFKSSTNKTWLVYQSVDEIVSAFYKFQDQTKTQSPPDQPPKALDYVQPVLTDCQNLPTVSQNVTFPVQYLSSKLGQARDRIFSNVLELRTNLLSKASDNDKEFLEESLETLDERLKQHYSLKGKLESEVYVKRSTEITNHKKKYQRHARTTKERMDAQTQKFNFLLQKSLQLMKSHTQQQKKVRQQLPTAKNLSQLQGLSGRNRQNSQRFQTSIKQILSQLQRLSTSQAQFLVDRNEQFLKECKEMAAGGEYSKEELDWYKSMMQEITTQLTQQKDRRGEKMREIEGHTMKKRAELAEQFEKDYANYVEELAARDCSGKKFGKPKRLAQQRLRMQMSKCQQAQQSLTTLLNSLRQQLQTQTPTLDIRRKLMTLRTCIGRYAKHIEALKPDDAKITQMPRVNYNEGNWSTALAASEQQQDEKRKQAELAELGPLSQQKDEKKFVQLVEEIEKVMKEEALKIYTAENKMKYITGADKIPDFLRDYIANMKKNAENFRLNCVRELRELCLELASFSGSISDCIFNVLLNNHSNKRIQATKPEFNKFLELQKEMQKTKAINTQKLRPNLSNPACSAQLDSLNNSETTRLKSFQASMASYKTSLLQSQFTCGSAFLTATLNNFEFLILYFDSMVLQEDFIKLPGDQTKEKKHLNLKDLMLLKQKGVVFDVNSERNITKKWPGVKYGMFDCGDSKFQYAVKVEEPPKVDPKKAGKGKDSKKEVVVEDPNAAPPGMTKDIQSIKTDRQKSAFEHRNDIIQQYKRDFDREVETFIREIDKAEQLERSYEAKWQETVEGFRKQK